MEMTRTKAIRLRCLDCSGGAKDVKECEFTDCELYQGRMGKRPKGFQPAKAITSYCKSCSNDDRRDCPIERCPLWEWRLGRSTDEKPKKP